MKRNVFLHLGVLLVTCLLIPTTVHALGDAERVFYSYDASDGLADYAYQHHRTHQLLRWRHVCAH